MVNIMDLEYLMDDFIAALQDTQVVFPANMSNEMSKKYAKLCNSKRKALIELCTVASTIKNIERS